MISLKFRLLQVFNLPMKFTIFQLQDKKPLHKYGLQGTHHLLPYTGKISSTLPTRTVLKKDKIYAWCSCGYSGTQVSLKHHFVILCFLRILLNQILQGILNLEFFCVCCEWLKKGGFWGQRIDLNILRISV